MKLVKKGMKIYSIGFENRELAELEDVLIKNGVSDLIDVRCFPEAESAGWAKGSNLKANLTNIQYKQIPILAPTPELLKDYFEDGLSWEKYEGRYLTILKERQVEKKLNPKMFEKPSCFMCSEHGPEKCHRRLALEYLQGLWGNLDIIHL